MLSFADVVEFGEGKEGFLKAVDKSLQGLRIKKQRRLPWAKENSWESRVEFMMDKIGAKINQGVHSE
jgi:hypothetical protein